jgi:serine/threonine-protein kinase HipA
MSEDARMGSSYKSDEPFRCGQVYVRDQYAGMIEERESGYRFTYAAEYLSGTNSEPVSLTLPLRAEPYASNILFPFFDGLIPEGWLLDVTVKTWKLSPRDRMGLLLTVCKDCIGAVSVVDASPPKEEAHDHDGK